MPLAVIIFVLVECVVLHFGVSRCGPVHILIVVDAIRATLAIIINFHFMFSEEPHFSVSAITSTGVSVSLIQLMQ